MNTWNRWLVTLTLSATVLSGTATADDLGKCDQIYSHVGATRRDMKTRGLKMPTVHTNLRGWVSQLFATPDFSGYQIADNIPLPEGMGQKILKMGGVLWQWDDKPVVGVVFVDDRDASGESSYKFIRGAKEAIVEQCGNAAAKISLNGPFPTDYTLLGQPKFDGGWEASRVVLACPAKFPTIMRISTFESSNTLITASNYSGDENAGATADSHFFHAFCSLSQSD
jgi:hypothetical protein